jgi:heme/copper-type cytochrome/quinol oxidase subunit 4
VVAILAVCVAAYAVLVEAFHWMNEPRDASVVGGVGMIFALLVIVPAVVHTIWRKL